MENKCLSHVSRLKKWWVVETKQRKLTPGALFEMTPKATTTPQNLPKPPSGANPSTRRAPDEISKASAHDCVLATPEPRLTPIRVTKTKERVRPMSVIRKVMRLGVDSG